MNPGVVVVGALALVVLAVGAGVAVAGVALLRRTSRVTSDRVPVEAVCVARTSMRQPVRVTLDHPLPGGVWRRVTLVEGMPTTSVTGATARPGDRVTVWADPHRPDDVRLSPNSAAGSVGGVLLVLVGALGCLGGLLFAGIAVLAATR